MTKVAIVGGAFAVVLALLALAVGYRALERDAPPAAATSPAIARSATLTPAPTETHPGSEDPRGLLYGRITTVDGTTYEGRLRFGGAEEASWGDQFNGWKDENPWAAHVPAEQRPRERQPLKILGVEIASRENELDLGKPFMARFGDIVRIEALRRDIRVTLKSGAVLTLDRFAADDLADGVRVWDGEHGVVDLGEWGIRTIELLPGPAAGGAPYRLHGTVRTRQGEFTGFIQWNREEGVGTDELDGRAPDGLLRVRFDTIRAIERESADSALVTLLDGREVVLSGTRDVGGDNRGMYVDDPRYGRVLVSWDAFERVDFSPGGSGPAYDDFPPGQPLMGSVATRGGGHLTGRLVFDLDESETIETLDAPFEGVDYTIPFGLIAAIEPPGRVQRGADNARVTLHTGEQLQLEPSGDLGKLNLGMLVFTKDDQPPDYIPWTEVDEVRLDRPKLMYPPQGER